MGLKPPQKNLPWPFFLCLLLWRLPSARSSISSSLNQISPRQTKIPDPPLVHAISWHHKGTIFVFLDISNYSPVSQILLSISYNNNSSVGMYCRFKIRYQICYKSLGMNSFRVHHYRVSTSKYISRYTRRYCQI